MTTRSASSQNFLFNVPTDALLSVATIPVLIGLVGAKVLSQSIVELGRATEEVFRGDRLPVLNLHQNPEDKSYP